MGHPPFGPLPSSKAIWYFYQAQWSADGGAGKKSVREDVELANGESGSTSSMSNCLQFNSMSLSRYSPNFYVILTSP